MKKIVVISAGFWVKLLAVLLLLAGLLSWGGNWLKQAGQTVAVLADQPGAFQAQGWLQQLWASLEEDELKGLLTLPPVKHNNASLTERMLTWVVGFNPTNPYQQLEQGMAVLTLAREETSGALVAVDDPAAVVEEDIYSDMAAMADDWHFEMSKLTDIALTDAVQIILYHTHNAETYLPTDGVSKRAGENAGVSTAADVFQQALEQKYGLKTLHSKVLHDYPDWNRSYINSLATVKSLLNANPEVKAVFDVHRDAGFTSKDPTTVMLGGKAAAKIMIVVGANHDHWKENLAFAQALEDKSNALYPNLVRSIRIVQANRYNQQAHPHSLILEIGSDLNTQEEANYALECFAQVVAEVLQEESIQ